MTATELNRDIKRLYKKFDIILKSSNVENYHSFVQEEGKKEFIRLYRADSNFNSLNLLSVKILIDLNRKHRYIPFHQFMINLEIKI